MIVVLDYGINNLRSVEKAIRYLGFSCSIQDNLKRATRLIIPGVGAFGKAMERLRPVAEEISEFAASGAPILGICLGQQLLFESSEEFGSHPGLGLIPGHAVYLNCSPELKVPHIGWSTVRFCDGAVLGRGLPAMPSAYFVHSLHTVCNDADDIAATTEYGITFASSVERGNVLGTQFHPEKSGDVGLQILRNFLEW